MTEDAHAPNVAEAMQALTRAKELLMDNGDG